jgi:hypothetical protein
MAAGRFFAEVAAGRATALRAVLIGLAAFAGVAAFRDRAALAAFTTGRLRAVRLATRARAAGFRDFLAAFAPTRRFAAFADGCLRLVAFRAVARPRPAALRAPPVFLPALRLAMARPFTSFRLP